MPYWLSRLRAAFQGRALDRDFNQELETHLDLLAEDLRRRGMSAEEARRAARVQLGGIAHLRESHRATRGLPMVDSFLQDVRYALRAFRRSPGFTALAVVTLAIGIGVNTAVFTAVNAAVLRPLPVSDPHRLMQLVHGDRQQFFSYSEFAYYRDNSRSFTGVAAMANSRFAMSGITAPAPPSDRGIPGAAGLRFPETIGGSEPVTATVVSANYFQLLGAKAVFGRTFVPGEDSPSSQRVAMLSDNFWDRRFGRDPTVLGRTIALDGVPATIVGITARDFGGTWAMTPDVWAPLIASRDDGGLCCRVYARLQPGATPRRAAEELNAIAARRPGGPSPPDRFVMGEASAGGRPRSSDDWMAPLLLLAAVGTVLLIACANVASLLLARSAARQREIAIRLAIGAGRGRLVRQLLTENMVMSLLAGFAAIVLSWWTLRFVVTQGNAALTSSGALALDLTPDYRVLAYILFLAFASAFAFGFTPALEASRPNLSSGLRDEGAAFSGRMRKSRLRSLMVGTQVALSLALLITAGLLARSSSRIQTVDLGFDYRNLVSLAVEFPRGASAARVAATRIQLAQQMGRLLEVSSVAVASRMPLVHGGMREFAVDPHGGLPDARGTPDAWYVLVTPSYFETLAIPIVRGRNFSPQEMRDGLDFDGSPVIVSEATARRFWPGEDPIGKRLSFGARRSAQTWSGAVAPAHSGSSTVIGVARDVRAWRLEMVDPTCVYLPVSNAFGGMNEGVLAMRIRGGEGRAVAAIRRVLRESYPDLQVAIGDERTALTTQTPFVASRLGALGVAIVGFLGLLMTSAGIYGTVGFAVAQRTQEIGIRMALGAARGEVLRLMLAQTMRPVGVGLAAGFALAAVVSRLMHAALFGLSTVDPIAFLGVSAFLAAVALLAGYVPARRATRVDPMVALRYE